MVALLAAHPEIGAPFDGDMRRVLLRRFSHSVIEPPSATPLLHPPSHLSPFGVYFPLTMATAPTTPGPTPTIRGLPRPLARAMEAYADRLDVDKIREAYDLAVEAHSGQRRASGDEYVSHTVEVATILATLRLDSASIIAGLIHDTVEDTALSVPDVEARFGGEVATIVDGVTKLGRVQFSSATEQQVENYRKMLLSMAEDARVSSRPNELWLLRD